MIGRREAAARTEDQQQIEPAVRSLRASGVEVQGPESADSVFARCLAGTMQSPIAISSSGAEEREGAELRVRLDESDFEQCVERLCWLSFEILFLKNNTKEGLNHSSTGPAGPIACTR